MTKEQFLKDFHSCFENIDESKIKIETEFRTLDEWDSLTALSVLAMIDSEYGKSMSAEELRSCKTVVDVFNYVEKE